MEYKSDVISLLKTRITGIKADKIIAKLGFFSPIVWRLLATPVAFGLAERVRYGLN